MKLVSVAKLKCWSAFEIIWKKSLIIVSQLIVLSAVIACAFAVGEYHSQHHEIHSTPPVPILSSDSHSNAHDGSYSVCCCRLKH